jgi:Phospholipase_D-nuclease N-terminal
VKLVLEILVSLLLHPLAFILAVIDIVRRDDLSGLKKLIWAIVSIAWGIGPILYILLADGDLW